MPKVITVLKLTLFFGWDLRQKRFYLAFLQWPWSSKCATEKTGWWVRDPLLFSSLFPGPYLWNMPTKLFATDFLYLTSAPPKREPNLPSYSGGAWGQRASVYPLGCHWRGQSHFGGLQSRCWSLWGRTHSLWRKKMEKVSQGTCVFLTSPNWSEQDKLSALKRS